jgi:hypothetical protein
MESIEQQIEGFRTFALQQLQNDEAGLSVDDLYDRWRLEYPSPDEFRNDVLAVKASLRDMKRGERGRSLEEFASEFRAKHGIDAE